MKKSYHSVFIKGITLLMALVMTLPGLIIINFTQEGYALASNSDTTYVEPITYEFNFLTTHPDASIYSNPNTEGWFAENAIVGIKDGCLKLKSTDPEIAIEGEADMDLNTNLYKAVKIVLKNETNADKLTVYFDSVDYNWSKTRSVSIKIVPNDVVFREYIIDMRQNSRWTSLISRCKIGFNNSTAEGTISLDRIGYYPDSEPSEIFYDFSKESNGVNSFENSSASFSSVLNIKSDGKGDARFKLVDNISADASKFKYVQFSVYNTSSAATIDVYYTTESDSTWTKTKSILNVPIKSKFSDVATYTVDMRKSASWIGRTKHIMFAVKGMNKDEIITFNSIALINREILPDIKINFKSNTNNFIANVNSTVLTKEVGINCVFNGENGGITSPATRINAKQFGFMKIKLSNNTMSTALRFQWLTENDNVFDIKKNQNIIIDAKSSDMKEYIIPLIDNQYWYGNITKLKLMPAIGTVKGDMTIESITFTQYADVSFLYRNVKEGFIDVPGDYGWIKNNNGGEIAGVNDKTVDIADATVGTGLYPTKLELRNFGTNGTTSAWKYFTDQTDGKLQWNFTLRVNKLESTGSTIKLMNDEKNIIVFEVVDNKIFLIRSNVTRILVRTFDLAEALEGINVRIDINNNLKQYTVTSLNDEITVANDIPFLSSLPINKLFVGTDGSCQTVVGFSEHITRINEMYEDFTYSKVGVKPKTFDTTGNVIIEKNRLNYTNPTYWNSTLGMRVANLKGNMTEKASMNKTFKVQSNVIDTVVKFTVKASNDETYIKLSDGINDAVKVKITGNDFMYFDNQTGQYDVLWDNFKESHPTRTDGFVDDIWYTLKIRTYLETRNVEVSINGVESKKTILPTGLNDINKISLETKGEIWLNDIRISDYRPTIVPYVDRNNNLKDGYVGVDAWQANTDSAERFYKNERIVNKRSYLGYTNDWDKESINWQLKWMAENGIDFISYFFCNLGYYAVDTYIDNAEFSDQVNFAYTMDDYAAGATMDLLPFMVERLFRNPKYIKYNNKPVLFYFRSHPEWPDDFAKTMNEYVKNNSTFDGIELVNVAHPITDDATTVAKRQNIKYVTEYWRSTTPELLEKSYSIAKRNGLDYIFKPSVGGDSRAWGLSKDYRAYNSIEYVTPNQFYNALKFTKSFISDKKIYSSDSLASKMVYIDNWSEFGEGHAICPYGDIGFGYINQVRRVFAGEDGLDTGTNSRPSAFVDHLFPTGWMIEKLNNPSFENTSIENWKANDSAIVEKVYNNEFNYEKNAVKVSARKSGNSKLYQDITNTVLSNGKSSLYNISAYVKPTQVEGFRDYDAERLLHIFSSKKPNMAIGLSADETTILLKQFNPNDDQQKWLVSKVGESATMSKFTFKNVSTGYYMTEEFVVNETPLSRIVMRAKEKEGKFSTQIFTMPQSVDTDTGEMISSNEMNGVAIVPDTYDMQISKGDFCYLFMIRAYNNYQNQDILFKTKDVTGNPQKPYRAPVSISIEISDSEGIKHFDCKGNAKLGSYTELTGSVNVSWVGNLNYARFIVNGDTASNRDYFVDECEMRYVPTSNKQIAVSSTVKGDVFISKYGITNQTISSEILIAEIAKGGQNVIIDLDSPGIIKKEVFAFIKSNNKNVTFRVKDFSGNVGYYWIFLAKDIDNTNIDVDISISQSDVSINAIDKVIKGPDSNNTQYIDFSYTGSLPGLNSIGVLNGKNFNTDQKLSLGSYSSTTDTAQNQNVSPKITSNYIEFKLNKIDNKNWYITSGQKINPLTRDEFNKTIIILFFATLGILLILLNLKKCQATKYFIRSVLTKKKPNM